MATAEMLSFDQSRRDLFLFARRKKITGRQPPEGSAGKLQSGTSQTPPQPDNNRFRFTKRQLIIGGTLAAGGSVLAALLKPWDWFIEKTETMFVDPQLQQLGKEIYNWQLLNGTSVIDISPETRKTTDILTGKVNPRSLIPIIKLPVSFDPNAKDAGFSLNLVDSNDNRRVLVTLPSGQIHRLNWISSESEATIQLSEDIKKSSVRWPILIIEVSQIYDFFAYSQLYLSLVQKAGIGFEVINPDNLLFSDLEKTIVVEESIRILEEKLSQKPSFFRTIVDVGSALRVGGILFANWYVDQLNRRIPISESADWVKGGQHYAGFLQSKGLITQQRRGGLFTWTNGQSPSINSEEFLRLVEEFSGKTRNVFI